MLITETSLQAYTYIPRSNYIITEITAQIMARYRLSQCGGSICWQSAVITRFQTMSHHQERVKAKCRVDDNLKT